ncbi:MAG: 3'-5' exonuclease [Chloroflexi bacterium]|nr:MAG: 3'-5' exonuclease [Chloroflexota bacterium]TME16738.1 MAG: 3'-5' exonuclease [Chloroflexota bacterium]
MKAGRVLRLKPRGAEPVEWKEPAEVPLGVSPDTPLSQAEYVAVDIETTGNRPFLVLEIGAERFRLDRSLALFDTLVNARAPINPYARRRHLIDRQMLVDAPDFADARRAFLHFARGSVLVEHSHDAFDTWLIGRGLNRPLENPVIDTTALARLVLELPAGQTPGLARLVEALEIEMLPAHAALGDAQATAAVFRELVRRGAERYGWQTVADLVTAVPRPVVDRSAMEAGGASRKDSSANRAQGARGRTGQPRPAAPGATPGATSPEPTARRGRSRRRRRSGSSGSPGGSPGGSPAA